MVGFDGYADPIRRRAMDLALQGERLAMTAAVKLAAFDQGESANAVTLYRLARAPEDASVVSEALGWGEPLGDSSTVPTLLLSRFVRREVTVALTGDGADELFWYTPGTGPDYVWTSTSRSGAPTSRPVTADGVATPVVGDYDHNGFDDILWYS